MLCQGCHTNEAENYFMANWNGRLVVTGFCSECMNKMEHRAAFSGYGNAFREMTGLYPGRETPRADGMVPFPEQADAELIRQMRLNGLEYQLKSAADREDYQEAARLRDAIRVIRKEEIEYGS